MGRSPGRVNVKDNCFLEAPYWAQGKKRLPVKRKVKGRGVN